MEIQKCMACYKKCAAASMDTFPEDHPPGLWVVQILDHAAPQLYDCQTDTEEEQDPSCENLKPFNINADPSSHNEQLP